MYVHSFIHGRRKERERVREEGKRKQNDPNLNTK
jgi:hypothetical protein